MALIDACYTFFLKRPEVWADNCSAPNYICVRSYLTLEEKQPGMYLSAAGFAGCWSCVFTVTARLIVLGLNGLQYVFENYMKKGRGLQSSFDCSDCTDGCLGSLICKMFPIKSFVFSCIDSTAALTEIKPERKTTWASLLHNLFSSKLEFGEAR